MNAVCGNTNPLRGLRQNMVTSSWVSWGNLRHSKILQQRYETLSGGSKEDSFRENGWRCHTYALPGLSFLYEQLKYTLKHDMDFVVCSKFRSFTKQPSIDLGRELCI